jgi:hypothetical protein
MVIERVGGGGLNDQAGVGILLPNTHTKCMHSILVQRA